SLSPPKPNLITSPQRLEPAAQGVKTPLTITIEAQSSFARLESWDLRIIGPDGALFRSYSGPWPAQALTWDGLSSTGKAVEPGARYTIILGVADEFSHAASAQLSIPVSELPFPSAKSSVRPWTSGFSPNGDGIMDTLDLSLAFGYPQAVATWKLELLDADSKAVKTWSGKGSNLPELVSWNGSAADGSRAPEGRYTASLSVDYGKSYLPDAAGSPSFVLDATPPDVSLSISPDYFSPDGDGFADTLNIKIEATTDLAKIVDWSIDVYVADGGAFHRFVGAWPAGSVVWDGRNAAGETVESAEEYPVVATVRDEFGNAGKALGFAGVDILLIQDEGGYRINITSIVFKGFTADYEDIPPDRAEQNIRTLNRLAEKLSRFPDHKIRLVGHAVMIYWDDPDRGAIEQQEVLMPLSQARAEAIAAALAERGIDAARMSTEGVGANDQVVPDSDYANRWKNRRVVFFLVRE
ncbi:MAG: OmpA family protein, partial [Spirochaetaceae bacterium]|nr:OmpA family protein [Spirochaetaceae bacterium]